MNEPKENNKLQYIDPVSKEDREVANQILDAFYKNAAEQVTLPDGKVIDVPDSGSLSLLAMGHTGVFAWRKSREKAYGQRIYSPFAAKVKDVLKERKKKIDEQKAANPKNN